jgi:hypothetical protein
MSYCETLCKLKEQYESNPIIIENLSPETLAIRCFVQNQSMHTFGMPIADYILHLLTDGFVLFNLRSNKYMLNSKTELLNYIADENVELEEKLYFTDIFLYNQRPSFLSKDEHEYIRACRTLDGFEEVDDYELRDDSPPPEPQPRERCLHDRRPTGFVKPFLISEELAQFLGKPVGTEMSRVDVSREINGYIRDNGLIDIHNGRNINPDDKLRKLLRLREGDELTYFTLQKHMKHHFIR